MHFGEALDEKRFVTLIQHAYEKGIRTFMTADVYGNGQADEMLGRAEKAIPDDLSPTFQAGRSLVFEKGDTDRAERYLRRYLTQEAEGGQPRWAAAHWRLGLVFEKRGMKQKAVQELETAVRLQPGLLGAKKDLERLR